MSKKRRKKWWQVVDVPPPQKRLIDDVAADPEEGYVKSEYYDYNYDWGENLSRKNKDGKKSWENAQSDFGESYGNYQKTGQWRGYGQYRQAQLTYKYVQQMANALAAQHRITVEIGDSWDVDLIKRKLTYNPASLIYGTKSELLATLMHEIGKLRYCDHSSKLQNKYLKLYKLPAMEVLSCFEDVRVDYWMLKAYESASEIYESAMPAVEKLVQDYAEYGRRFRRDVPRVLREQMNNIISSAIQKNHSSYLALTNGNKTAVDELQNDAIKMKLASFFGTSDISLIKASIENMVDHYMKNGSIYEYCAEMFSVMYDLDHPYISGFPNIEEKVNNTIHAIEPAKKKDTSQTLVDYLDTDVYPHVEDLLKDLTEKSDILDKIFPKMPEQAKRDFINFLKEAMGGGLGVNVGYDGNNKTRTSGMTSKTTPPEWAEGDYKTLKESVSSEIRSLMQKLMFIKREELVIRYEHNQKRGKLHAKKLYKVAIGSRRLFKNKLANVDTVQSFAFSIIIDVSSSMHGDRIIHTTRASIILAEVFKRMQIPFEMIVFNDGAKHLKKFEEILDKTKEKKIGGMVRGTGGGTNMHNALDVVKVHTQPEKNKIAIVLSDGGVGGMSEVKRLDEKYFIPWQKQNIKSVGFGVECEDLMKYLCQGNSRVLNNAGQLPMEFTNLIKSLIRKR